MIVQRLVYGAALTFLVSWLPSSRLQEVEICNTDGALVCSEDCKQIVECIEDGDSFQHLPLEQCSAEKFCYLTEPELSCQYHSACKDPAQIPFQCTAQAVFPDPYDCNQFYMCLLNNETLQLEARHVKCPDGIAFDYVHRYCNIPITETGPPSCVQGPVPFCLSLGQSGPLVEDDNVYYVCHRQEYTLFPVLYQCPGGGAFNTTRYGCDL